MHKESGTQATPSASLLGYWKLILQGPCMAKGSLLDSLNLPRHRQDYLCLVSNLPLSQGLAAASL